MITRSKVSRTPAQWFAKMHEVIKNPSCMEMRIKPKIMLFTLQDPPPRDMKNINWWDKYDHETAQEIRKGEWS